MRGTKVNLKVAFVVVFLLYVITINPITLGYFDPSPPISFRSKSLIYTSYFVLLFVLGLFLLVNRATRIAIVASSLVLIVAFSILEFGSYIILGTKINAANKFTTPGFPSGFSVTGRPVKSSLEFKSGREIIAYKTNEYGFRDITWGVPEKMSGVKIALFGDSFTEGWGVQQDDIVAYRLRSLMPESSVMNFGLQGSGPGFARCIYKEIGAKFRPDVVVFLSFMGNDFIDSENELVECIRNRNPANSFWTRFPYSLSLFRLFAGKNTENDQLLRNIKRHSNYSKLEQNFRNKVESFEVHLPLLSHALHYPYTMRDATRVPSDDKLQAYKTHIEGFFRDTLEQGAPRFILVKIPVSTQVSKEQTEELNLMGFKDFIDSHGSREPQRALLKIIQDSGLDKHIEIIDLHEKFLSLSGTERLYLEFDNHINANGHEVIAEEIATAVMSKK